MQKNNFALGLEARASEARLLLALKKRKTCVFDLVIEAIIHSAVVVAASVRDCNLIMELVNSI